MQDYVRRLGSSSLSEASQYINICYAKINAIALLSIVNQVVGDYVYWVFFFPPQQVKEQVMQTLGQL